MGRFTSKVSESVSLASSKFREVYSHEPTRFVTAYVLSGLLVILVPAIQHAKTVIKYQQSYYAQYNNGNDRGSGDSYRDVNNCSWINPFCSSIWVNQNGEVQQNDAENSYYGQIPSWFSGWESDAGGSRDAGMSTAGSLKFVYAWEIVLFLGLLFYGSMVLFKYRGNLIDARLALRSLWLLIFVFGNFCFLVMWLLADGSIYTNGRGLENAGNFYNQFSVMMFVTNFWYLVWSIVFLIAVAWRVPRPGKTDPLLEGERNMTYTVPYKGGEEDSEACVRGST